MRLKGHAFAETTNVSTSRSARAKIEISEQILTQMFVGSCAQTRKNFLGWIERAGDQQVKLKTGSTTSIYGLMLLAVSRMEPIHRMGMSSLARKMRDRVDGPADFLTPTAVEAHVKAFMQRLGKNPHSIRASITTRGSCTFIRFSSVTFFGTLHHPRDTPIPTSRAIKMSLATCHQPQAHPRRDEGATASRARAEVTALRPWNFIHVLTMGPAKAG